MALTNTDVKEIEKIARKEMKDFLETTQAHTIVMKIIQKEIGARSVDERIVDLSSKVVVPQKIQMKLLQIPQVHLREL